MSRHLTPRRLGLVAASLGMIVAAFGALGWVRPALVATGLSVAVLALLVWRVHVELRSLALPQRGRRSRTATQADQIATTVDSVAARVEDSERRIIAALETLRRDAIAPPSAPPRAPE
jgi:hypothetical protein